MSQLLERFTTLELPDAIDAVLLGTDDLEPGTADAALSRYASRLLGELGASRMREIAVSQEVGVGRLSNTDLFWLRYDADSMADEEVSYLLASEGIMNRLRLIEEHLAAPISKHLVLRKPRVVNEGDCAIADVEVIEGIADAAPTLLNSSENPLATLHGVVSHRGGEWDLRTRLALALESLRLPYRLAYRFDCDASEGVFSIDYTVPEPAWIPKSRYLPKEKSWVDATDQQDQMASDYAVRLGALIAAAAFGAGVGVRRVQLKARSATLQGSEVLCLLVERIHFVAEVLPAIERGEKFWHDAFRILFTGSDPSIDEHLAARHIPLEQDTRQLPDDLRELLLADTACELDVFSHLEGERWEQLKEAQNDAAHASPMAAIASLEEIVDAGGDIEADEQGRYPLYCLDAVSRVWVSEAAVSDTTRYVRYPDAAFSARSLLCDLYGEMGEPERAFQQAQVMIQLAPTSTIGYTDAANALFEQDRHGEAIPFLQKALSLATQDVAISWIFYRLAYALWQSGKHKEGLACYAMSAHHGFPRAQLIAEEAGQLMKEMKVSEPPTFSEALDVLDSYGLEPPFSIHHMHEVAVALIRLTEEGIFSMASLLCATPGLMPRHRDELFVVARSMSRPRTGS